MIITTQEIRFIQNGIPFFFRYLLSRNIRNVFYNLITVVYTSVSILPVISKLGVTIV